MVSSEVSGGSTPQTRARVALDWGRVVVATCARGVIVTLQTLIFLVAFVLAPKHGLLAARARAREALKAPAAAPEAAE